MQTLNTYQNSMQAITTAIDYVGNTANDEEYRTKFRQ